jgi:hypothetical protein
MTSDEYHRMRASFERRHADFLAMLDARAGARRRLQFFLVSMAILCGTLSIAISIARVYT